MEDARKKAKEYRTIGEEHRAKAEEAEVLIEATRRDIARLQGIREGKASRGAELTNVNGTFTVAGLIKRLQELPPDQEVPAKVRLLS